ncbi:MAG TPA: class I SAM-dependent methyltransferase [Vicinamibacterales bacterium]|nr:class I SAM-dependent methyltransferase [Vicinamibacterales bacterium]
MKETHSTRRDHYSYTVYADPTHARAFDERRFGGPIGDLVAATQARVLVDFAGSVRGRAVLDVGTGTGRAALILAREGASVTGLDASDAMLDIAKQRAVTDGLDVRFLRGDAHALEFADRSFDITVSLRVLMHTPDWRRSVAELCRVADRLVIVDYPSAHSVALIQSLGRRAAYAVRRMIRRSAAAAGGREPAEPYRVFSDRSIAEAFELNGFNIRSIHKSFVLPIALHKAIGRTGFTGWSEGLLERVGLLGLVGSPVSIVAERATRATGAPAEAPGPPARVFQRDGVAAERGSRGPREPGVGGSAGAAAPRT